MAYYHSRYATSHKKKRKPFFHKLILFLLFLLIIAAGIVAYAGYHVLYKNNVWINNADEVSVFIPTGSGFDDVKSILYSQGIILHRNSFEWVAIQKKYPELIKPGHYVITKGMSNDELINLLRSGEQTPVKVIFNSLRSKEHLARIISLQLEVDSAEIIDLLNDSSYMSKFDLKDPSGLSLFIPNTYEFYWNTRPTQFLERMYSEYQQFWNNDRRMKAESMGFSIPDVITLASIVEKETAKNDEKDDIAGVYINRLNLGWRLQADPTLIYALNDYSIRRVLNRHKEVDSPYNTYKYGGLPPGPICIPSIASIDAVLNHTDHDYLFFCARDDLSGYHVFAKTSEQHAANARKFQRVLDEMNIRK